MYVYPAESIFCIGGCAVMGHGFSAFLDEHHLTNNSKKKKSIADRTFHEHAPSLYAFHNPHFH